MSKLTIVKKQCEELASLVDLVKVYQQIASRNVIEVKQQIKNKKDYFEGLSALSSDIGMDIDKVAKAREKAVLLLSTDGKMYGDITERVFRLFLDYILKNPGEAVFVIGSAGVQLMDNLAPNKKYSVIKSEDFGKLVENRDIKIFYAQYKNLAYQDAASDSVSGLVSSANLANVGGEETITKYFYEPSLAGVLDKFTNSITAGLVWYTLSQSKLAMSAARVLHLERTLTNSQKISQKLRKKMFGFMRREMQMKTRHQYQLINSGVKAYD